MPVYADILQTLNDLDKKIDDFANQYELDMRGDKTLQNGNRGVIGEIRDIKEYMRDYPSITYLFARHPFKVIAVALGVFVIFMTLYTLGMLKIVGAAVGISLP